MNGSAIFMLLFIGVIIWGGFIAALVIGMKKEKSK
ncbi:MetS family NSS transporter small subunit [candidate division KSB1 bacterium]